MITNDYQALKQHFLDTFSGQVAIVWDNQPPAIRTPGANWCRFSVRAGDAHHDAGSAQDGLKSQLGRVWMQIFTPEGMGEGSALSLADTFAAAFRNITLDGGAIRLGTESINTDPIAEDGYYMISVSIPWESLRRYV